MDNDQADRLTHIAAQFLGIVCEIHAAQDALLHGVLKLLAEQNQRLERLETIDRARLN